MNEEYPVLRSVSADLLRPQVHDRIIILTGSAAASRRMAAFLEAAGAAEVLSVYIEDVPTETQQRFEAYDRALTRPDEKLANKIRAANPAGDGLVYAGSFSSVEQVLGRRVIGSRKQKHADAERKQLQFELSDTGGCIMELDVGLPRFADHMVVQGIPNDSIAMATSHTYMLPAHADEQQTAYLIAQLRRDCRTAVVRPLDSGTPCTFYGFVTPEWIIDFGPVEALVYWHGTSLRLHAPGILRPLLLDRDLLVTARTAVHKIAQRLLEVTGYIGAFGTDGVLCNRDYRIHEINPRVCAGFSLLDEIVPGVAPLAAVDLILRECGPVAVTALREPAKHIADIAQGDSSMRVKLWEPTRSFDENVPDTGAWRQDPATWAYEVRKALAAAGLVHITDLAEVLR
ncbi:MAG: hypothetical protein ACRDPY_16375 [Streptosporangiaceae bacterium]